MVEPGLDWHIKRADFHRQKKKSYEQKSSLSDQSQNKKYDLYDFIKLQNQLKKSYYLSGSLGKKMLRESVLNHKLTRWI